MNKYSMFVLMFALLAGCSSTFRPANLLLETRSKDTGYRGTNIAAHKSSGETFIILAFSGGGTRAAAFSYGVLKALKNIEVNNRPLLNEVDTITSVSGGSFTAAYYGLFGDKIFTDFEAVFLKQKVQQVLVKEFFRPKNWFRLFSTYFDRSELAIEYYDNKIFNGATFADLMGNDKPFIQINSTDLAIGNRFTFNQEYFDLICSDLSKFKIARAVAASSAVPLLFNSIVLRNYSDSCEHQKPQWFIEALNEKNGSRRYHNAKAISTYFDESRKYIHLVDGGISDNLGVRTVLDKVIDMGGIKKTVGQNVRKIPNNIAIILVNAETTPDYSIDKFAFEPSLNKVISHVSNTQIRRYNFETIELLRQKMVQWSQELSQVNQDVRIHLIEVSFDAVKSREEWLFFNRIPTSFNLAPAEVDKLISAGQELLLNNSEFNDYISQLKNNGR